MQWVYIPRCACEETLVREMGSENVLRLGAADIKSHICAYATVLQQDEYRSPSVATYGRTFLRPNAAMRIGIIGCGLWARYQVAAWKEADPDLQFAFCDRIADSARVMADHFGAAPWYTDAAEMLRSEALEAVDIITNPDSHAELVGLAAGWGLPVICQKPLGSSLETARQMVEGCRQVGVPLYVHENFRWQHPIRHLQSLLREGWIGKPFRARIFFNSGFPIFENQPFLARQERMILAEVGLHLLDICRFLFGEPRRLFCVTQRINPTIQGEDVATVLLEMATGMSCTVEMSYASLVDYECFPQTLMEVEGEQGSIRLSPDYRFDITTHTRQQTEQIRLPEYDWVNPQYAVVQTSMVELHRHFLLGLRNGQPVETTGADNLRSLELTYAAYESARRGETILLT